VTAPPWGIDALVGEQTRQHSDLDLMRLVHDLSGFRRSQAEALLACDFFECPIPLPCERVQDFCDRDGIQRADV
jgi:hypothetical protein